jgi:uncharacterized SAM-binding protein YcdF (DUF218 family)
LTYFFIKKLIGDFATPAGIAIAVATVGVVFRWCRWRRTSRVLFVTAVCLGYLDALVPIGDVLLWPLEHRYPPLRLDETPPGVGYIVVLGSSYEPRAGFPVTAALNDEGLVRIVEGVRLARQLKTARLVVSGGAQRGQASSAQGYARLATELGINAGSLIILDYPLDTHAEALAVSATLGQAPFILTTSAYHMPRAMLEMQHAGVRPIPAPTGHRASDHLKITLPALLPSSVGLRKSELALHEYFGLFAMTLGLE